MHDERPEPRVYTPQEEVAIKDAGLHLVWRLKELMARGYRPILVDEKFRDEFSLANSSITLEHPRGGSTCRAAYLRSDGSLHAHDGWDYANIERWEVDRFISLLYRIPKPNLWDTSKQYVPYIIAFALLMACAWWFAWRA